MRFLHTADWHLGRLFHGVHLTSEQEKVLDQLVELAAEARPDAVLVAGDVYDRAVPPPEAVGLLDDVLSRLVLGLRIPVIVVAGNHDSPERLEFGARLLAAQGLHVTGWPALQADPVTLDDKHGPVVFCALPYAEPAVVRAFSGQDEVHDHSAALAALVAAVEARLPHNGRRVAVAHAFLAGGQECDSERPLSVGNAGAVDPGVLSAFHYVALGHLHRPQQLGEGRLGYAGSLMKYSFSEIGQQKSVQLIELDGQGAVLAESIPLRPPRDLRRVEGSLEDILAGRVDLGDRSDYLVISLLDRLPVLDAMARLQRVLPNVLHVERPGLAAFLTDLPGGSRPGKLDPLTLFARFYHEVTGEGLSREQTGLLQQITQQGAEQDREAESSAATADRLFDPDQESQGVGADARAGDPCQESVLPVGDEA